jgi:hypothetical protein
VRDFKGTLQRESGVLEACVESATVGEGGMAGSLSGRYLYRSAGQTFEADVSANCAPAAVLPAFRDDPGLLAIIQQIECRGAPPAAQIRLQGTRKVAHSIRLDGQFSGTNVLYRGVPLDQVSLDLVISNRNVRLGNVMAVQYGRPLKGWVEIQHKPRMVKLDVESGIPPANLAPIIGENTVNLASWLHVRPPFDGWVRGWIDLEQAAGHDLSAQISSKELGHAPFVLNDANAYVTLTGPLLTVSHVQGTLHGGTFRGMGQLSGIRSLKDQNYFVELVPEKVNLSSLLGDFGIKEMDRSLGLISGKVTLEGKLGSGEKLNSLTGEGQLDIIEGQLFQIPFFGGLSKVLSAIIPGFGFAEQTELRMAFTIGKEQVAFSEARLLGNLISALGSGSVGFNGDLSLLVQVKLLREGILAKALQIISWPITKLFEFKLVGNVKEPQWRPQNLPKELFLKFD